MALSKAQKGEIARLFDLPPETIVVVGAGYDTRLFNSNPKPDPNPVQLVYAGKLSKAKGVPWLLRALLMIDYPAWQLHLVGDGSGEEKDSCLRLTEQMGKRVCLHGAVSQEDLARIMKQSHILVLPSFYEGLPLVLLEGLASGCRIIATNLPGVNEMLGEVQGDFVSLVKAPRLLFLDEPHNEDENVFEQDLAHALQTQIRAACQRPEIDLSFVRDQLAVWTWTGIFKNIQDVYPNAAE
jgi:glycosyltransferase involved in cell wall biosynthesis